MKTILKFALIGLFFIIANPAYAVHPHVSYLTTPTWLTPEDMTRHLFPQTTFIRKFEYTYTPTGGTETTVNALDINGLNLFLANSAKTLITIPIIKLGGRNGISLTVLEQTFLTGNIKQVIVQLPETYLTGNYEIFIEPYTNSLSSGSAIATLPESLQIGPQGIQGLKGDKGDIGVTGPSGNTNLKKWVYFNGRSLTKHIQNGIGAITRNGHNYTINFSPAFSNGNYVMTDATSNGHCFIREQSANRAIIYCLNTSGQPTPADFINLVFIK